MEYNIYCDESCHLEHDKSDVMVLGGVYCDKSATTVLNKKIRDLKVAHGFKEDSELKWTKISRSNVTLYKDLVDLFFNEPIYFRAYIATHKSQLNNAAYHQSYNEWYYKMYYKMLVYVIDYYCFGNTVVNLFIDIKDTVGAEKLSTLKAYLNRHARRDVVSNAQLVRSHQVPLVQLADVLTGALCYNARGLKTSDSKLEVIAHIQSQLNVSLSARRSSRNKFSWFVWKPAGGPDA